MPSQIIKIGPLGCSHSLEFNCTIENKSNLEIPVIILNLPSWVRLVDESNADDTEGLDIAFQSKLMRPRESSGMSSIPGHHPRKLTDDLKLSKKSLGALKLEFWLENKSILHCPAPDTEPLNRATFPDIEVDSLSNNFLKSGLKTADDLSVHDVLYNQIVNFDEESSEFMSRGTELSMCSRDSNFDSNDSNYGEEIRLEEQNSVYGNSTDDIDDELNNLSMKVTDQSVFVDSPKRFCTPNSLSQSVVEDIYDSYSNLPSKSRNKRIQRILDLHSIPVFIPAKSTCSLKLLATAPRVESQCLEHVITVRNLLYSVNDIAADSYGKL